MIRAFSILFSLLMITASLRLNAEADHDTPSKAGNSHESGKHNHSGSTRPKAGRCGVLPSQLSEFANGEAYNFPAFVSYLSDPACLEVSRDLGAAALSHGVVFSNKAPFKLESYSKGLSSSDMDRLRKIDAQLAKSFPALLRGNPLSQSELLPIAGQVAILSPAAGRAAWVQVIQNELGTADNLMSNEQNRDTRARMASELAKNLVKLGANQSVLASDVAASVEEMAVLSQADQLGKFFRALGAATTADASLAPTFNLSAGALNRGVQRGKKIYAESDRNSLLKSAFDAVKAALFGHENLEPGAIEMNESLGALLDDQALEETSLRKAWKESVRLLSQTPTQPALARAVALSINPEFLFLSLEDRSTLFAAAKQYPDIAMAVQGAYLSAWNELRNDLHSRKLSVGGFNQVKDKYMAPVAAEILDLGSERVQAVWLKEVWRRGLLSDEDIEKKFPRLMLAELQEQSVRALEYHDGDASLDNGARQLAENFGTLWTLSSLHVPALSKWVDKYEK